MAEGGASRGGPTQAAHDTVPTKATATRNPAIVPIPFGRKAYAIRCRMKAENLNHPDTPLIEALYTINNPTSFVARGYFAAN